LTPIYYLLLFLALAALVVAILLIQNGRRRQREEEEIRDSWGKVKTDEFNFNLIRRLSNQDEQSGGHRVSEQTIFDLDLYEVFAFIDRTNSRIGQQLLFKKLLEPQPGQVNQYEHHIQLFSSDSGVRLQVQKELRRLNHRHAFFASSMLAVSTYHRPQWFSLLRWSLVAMALCLLAGVFYPAMTLLVLIPFALNTGVHYWFKSNSFFEVRALSQMNLLIEVAQNICAKNPALSNASIKKALARLSPIRNSSFLIGSEPSASVQTDLGQVGMFLSETVKAGLLVEVFAYDILHTKVASEKEHLRAAFSHVGEIDIALSIASLRAGDSSTCIPEFIETAKTLRATALYHPLIRNCVANNLSLEGKSMLVTGSNMSGKSTFLRTLAVNALLAQTINTCFASSFTSSPLRPFTSIRIDDSITEGRSYYFQEVATIGELIGEAQQPVPCLFVLDEVFKGTNSAERIAAAKAVLSFLNGKDNLVIVSTHDMELTELLQHEFELYHFSEVISGNALDFDHLLKKGPLKTQNAISLLELSGYPEAITSEARAIFRSGSLRRNADV